ncbi:MAG: Methionine-tRNA ligase [Microgenomates group bacterium GW2011_GWC1_43_13]|uniref:Methionine--tRNA ligase n=2 Tax=Candidatus Woeseibacteriota TaxID=1752722 RepID=A0A837IC37_9BACT|nr:MAG: Methionine-tRNA ligase [Microgenomates group bacterium GW2011_GWC1_43_13]KKT33318.1 MAG: Methionine-tRNA ligase [Candidatus Woesebacteria bacterium GW2011_GWB1_44_11]KKT54602.1 MAG: Methionine-tRNA ligase [Candidatus Woesebacteria bacterium GW2011_GWA1_44_23]OGM75651.1 MAG: methionine--tRNA ligase [Candidatus Woesebacteria bacterium RIFOXYA1_FULL_43_16]OGM83673.1 MAG: methionine--tRNA ligase [Candidatus Woesebacteria bacterium RIFOXYC1_FULL_43_18]
MDKKFYITAAIPYVNAAPHIGHALEFVQTDTIARYHKLMGESVLTLSGGDENALKNVQAAEKAGEEVQAFVDKNTEKFFDLTKKINCQFDIWQKGSDQKHHFPSAQKLWGLCGKAGDIYKKTYEGLYCVGCEQFYLPSELNENGECFEHPGKKLEIVSEENYFFKLSKYQKELVDLIESDKLKIIPIERKNEVLSFLKEPLQDISISRSNERAKNWGVPVPNDKTQRIYVWFDALNIYQSGVGFSWDEEKYKKWWPADLHVIGKGITRFHAVYWPAFLLSAKLQLPKAIFIHGYFTVNGQKMSKTLGNVIDPVNIIEKYGADALRYYLLAKFSPFTDGDFSEEKLKDVYNGELANGLGNLVARIAKVCENIDITMTAISKKVAGVENKIVFWIPDPDLERKYIEAIKNYRFDEALRLVWEKIADLDGKISNKKPWEYGKSERDSEEIENFLKEDAVLWIRDIAKLLKPFLPETAEKIEKQFKGPKIVSGDSLFPRLI